jgi:hypothetical protein
VPVAKAEVKGGKGVQITGKPGGGGVAGSSGYKISNRQATRDMDWLCAISSMEGALCAYYLFVSLVIEISAASAEQGRRLERTRASRRGVRGSFRRHACHL